MPSSGQAQLVSTSRNASDEQEGSDEDKNLTPADLRARIQQSYDGLRAIQMLPRSSTNASTRATYEALAERIATLEDRLANHPRAKRLEELMKGAPEVPKAGASKENTKIDSAKEPTAASVPSAQVVPAPVEPSKPPSTRAALAQIHQGRSSPIHLRPTHVDPTQLPAPQAAAERQRLVNTLAGDYEAIIGEHLLPGQSGIPASARRQPVGPERGRPREPRIVLDSTSAASPSVVDNPITRQYLGLLPSNLGAPHQDISSEVPQATQARAPGTSLPRPVAPRRGVDQLPAFLRPAAPAAESSDPGAATRAQYVSL